MSPRTSTILAFIGVLLAGIPLPALTTARREVPTGQEQAQPEPSATRATYATLQCSGKPMGLRLLHEGRELVRLSGNELETPWEAELMLPAHERIALEIEAGWPEGCAVQAVSLTLEPEGLPTQQRTEWTEPGNNTLHSIFSFSW